MWLVDASPKLYPEGDRVRRRQAVRLASQNQISVRGVESAQVAKNGGKEAHGIIPMRDSGRSEMECGFEDGVAMNANKKYMIKGIGLGKALNVVEMEKSRILAHAIGQRVEAFMNLGDSKDHRSHWNMWNFQVLLKGEFGNIELIQWLCRLFVWEWKFESCWCIYVMDVWGKEEVSQKNKYRHTDERV